MLDQMSKLAVSLPYPQSLHPSYILGYFRYQDPQLLQSPPMGILPISTSSEGTNVEQADARGKQGEYADYWSFSRLKSHWVEERIVVSDPHHHHLFDALAWNMVVGSHHLVMSFVV